MNLFLALAMRPNMSIEDRIKAENQLTSGVKEFMINLENYPEIKAHDSFLHYQRTSVECEAQISAARRFYNSCVNEYNSAIQMFPNNIIAPIFNFTPRTSFKINEQTREFILQKRKDSAFNERKVDF